MIVILVEGDGDKKAIPILLHRAIGMQPNRVKCIDMKGKSNIIRQHDGFEKTILRQPVPPKTPFFVLLDQEGPREPYGGLQEEMQGMHERAQNLNATHGLAVTVSWAVREFESWLIGGFRKRDSYCGLINIRQIPGDTQAAPADPKEWIIAHRNPRRYDSNTPACLTRHVDVRLARQRNNSLDEFLSRVVE